MVTLTVNDSKIINGMIARGDKQHDIAAWFGENQARIVEVGNGDYGTSEIAPADQLPPKGSPGIKGRRLLAFVNKAMEALDRDNLKEARQHLQDGINRFNRHE